MPIKPVHRHSSGISRRSLAALALLGLLAASLGGCTWLAMAQQRTVGTPIPPHYTGLAGRSLAIVVYADDSTTYEYPQARQEVSSFVANSIEKHLRKVRLLNYRDVIRYQNDTLNWQELPVKTAQHTREYSTYLF